MDVAESRHPEHVEQVKQLKHLNTSTPQHVEPASGAVRIEAAHYSCLHYSREAPRDMAGIVQAESGACVLAPPRWLKPRGPDREPLAIPVNAEARALAELLSAELFRDFEKGPVDAVHFAGHGDFDKAEADGARLYLATARRFLAVVPGRRAMARPHQPFLFLNACMGGIGGETLGDMSGFPGNCLRGGFGGVLGALWEIDDQVANAIAEEFWRRVLPATGPPEPVGVRPARTTQEMTTAAAAWCTHALAYVFYGHPRLVLRRVHTSWYGLRRFSLRRTAPVWR